MSARGHARYGVGVDAHHGVAGAHPFQRVVAGHETAAWQWRRCADALLVNPPTWASASAGSVKRCGAMKGGWFGMRHCAYGA